MITDDHNCTNIDTPPKFKCLFCTATYALREKLTPTIIDAVIRQLRGNGWNARICVDNEIVVVCPEHWKEG